MYNSNAQHHFVQYSSADHLVAFAVICNAKHDAERERENGIWFSSASDFMASSKSKWANSASITTTIKL